jgi:hypothetical protein
LFEQRYPLVSSTPSGVEAGYGFRGRSRPRLCGGLFLNPQKRPARFWLYATACLYALFNDSSTAVSDDDLDRLTPCVQVMLILESLQRRG